VKIHYKLKENLYKYRQKYQDTVQLPDYVDYYTSGKWKVYIEYSGKVQSLNLTAKKITILNQNKKPVDHLIKGQDYQAKIMYKNTGTHNYYVYTNGLYENKRLLHSISFNENQDGIFYPNTSKTNYIPFTAKNAGTRTFKALVNTYGYKNELNPN